MKLKLERICKTTTNKYYISILIDNKKELTEKKSIKIKTTVGIDLGIKDFVITSDGERFKNQDFFKSAMTKLRIEQSR